MNPVQKNRVDINTGRSSIEAANLPLFAHSILRSAIFFLLIASSLLLSGCSVSSGAADVASTQSLVHLPADNAMHPTAHNEWWYVVGHVFDGSHHRFGFETTLFKFTHLHVPGFGNVSIDKTDVALTDVHAHRFIPLVTYLEPGLAAINLATKRFDEQMGSTRLWSTRHILHLSAVNGSVKLLLKLVPRRQALIEGGQGIVPMGSGGTSYYYSYPNLAVSGSIHYLGQWRKIHGTAWMDHQWGNWNWSNIWGWTWGAIQLSNGVDFSISNFRGRGQSLHGLSVSFPSGSQKTFSRAQIKPIGFWTSPVTKVRYGSGWTVTAADLDIHLRVTPLVTNQLVYDSTRPAASYWEGACSVTGTFKGRLVRGKAYMELVGGSRRFRVV